MPHTFKRRSRISVPLCVRHLPPSVGLHRLWVTSLLVSGLWGGAGCLEESPADLEGMSRDGARSAGPVNPDAKPTDASAVSAGASGDSSGQLPPLPASGVNRGSAGAANADPAVAGAPGAGSGVPGQPPPQGGGAPAAAASASNVAPSGPPSGSSGSTTSGRHIISEDHSDVPRKTQEELQSASATLTLSGTIQCSICKGSVLINVVDSQGLLTYKKQAPGAYELKVPEGAGAVTLTVIADQNDDGNPNKGEPLGFLATGGLTLAQKDMAGLDFTIQ